MTIYLMLLSATAVLGFLCCEQKQSTLRSNCFMVCSAALLVLTAALRADTVGVDTISYLKHFYALCANQMGSHFEPGYQLFVWIISRITANGTIFLGISSGAIIVLRFIFMARYSRIPWLSAYLYLALGFFGYAMCTIRQELAISVALFALPFLQRRNLWAYLAIVMLAATFHYSMLVLLPLYILAWLPLNKVTLGVYGLLTAVAMLFSETILSVITRYVYTGYQPNTYYTMGRNYATVIFPILLFVVPWLARGLLLRRNPQNLVLINGMLYSSILFTLTLRHFVFQRLALILLPTALLLVPELLCCIAPETLPQEEKPSAHTRQQTILLRRSRKNQQQLYYTTLAMILVAGLVYFMFLLVANRLKLVPYLLRFAV